eukprot:scpid94746/ scgid24372/ 
MSGARGGQNPRFDADKKLALWSQRDLMRLQDCLMELIDGAEMRLVSEYLISPFIVSGGRANILVENRLPRSRQLTDAVFLTEMLKVWMDRDGNATLEKLCGAIEQIMIEDKGRARQCRRHLGL